MTALDREQMHSGYWPSPWPVECGGNRRQKAAVGRLDAESGTAHVTTSRNGRWNVMAVRRDPGEWYVGGTMAAFAGPPPFGWVQRLDPETLDVVAESPELPCGDHVWCGAILAHANGAIYSVNGSYLHRLSATDLSIESERALVDRSHNGLLALSDGTLVTKDLRLEGQGDTTVTRLDPDTLDTVGQIVLPEGSMGRIAADSNDSGDVVYVPGSEHLWRLVADSSGLRIDDTWQPRYRTAADEQGLSWDACLSDGACWVMDCGDLPSIRMIHTTSPNGRFAEAPGSELSWRRSAPWNGPQRLLRIGLVGGAVDEIAPFGTPGGGIIAPPVHVPEVDVCVAWDSVNGGLAGIDTSGSEMRVAWQLDVRPSMQPVVFPESAELVINDFTADGADDVIVVDLRSGELIDRVSTGSRIANGMFLTAGDDRDIWYCTTASLARIAWS